MGAFICTISERDWPISREKGVYGNREKKEGTNEKLKDNQIQSIIRDLISMKEGDIVFFHIRGKQSIHGVYEIRKVPFYDTTNIFENIDEIFPYRFLYKPHTQYTYLAEYDANIDVHSLYEYIDRGEIKSLVTLENEMNIEGRGVRKILMEDANIIINLLHRDFKLRKSSERLNFNPYVPQNPQPLKNFISKVGFLENAIKAVIMYRLSNDIEFIKQIFNDNEISNSNNIDFVNEFFIAPTTRKSVDIYGILKNQFITTHLIIEVKTNQVDQQALIQALYYRDLLGQRNWVNRKNEKIEVVLVGKRFSSDLINEVKKLNKIGNGIKLMKYIPQDSGKWGEFENVH